MRCLPGSQFGCELCLADCALRHCRKCRDPGCGEHQQDRPQLKVCPAMSHAARSSFLDGDASLGKDNDVPDNPGQPGEQVLAIQPGSQYCSGYETQACLRNHATLACWKNDCVPLLFCTTKSIFVRISEREMTFEVNLPTHLGELTFQKLGF